jgi:N-acetylglucosamine-6-phosphate deacetylase
MVISSSEKPKLQVIDPGVAGAVVAKDYRDGASWRLTWDEKGLRELVGASEEADLWFAPGLFDLQVNGYGGVDFQRPCSQARLEIAAEALRRGGCHRALLTLVTCHWDQLLAKIASLREIVRNEERLHKAFPGWHFEGPFLSGEPGFSGAHNPKWMRDPTKADILRLKSLVGDDPVLITLAPERSGAIEAISQAVKCGFVVSFGHTNATDLRSAVAAGGTAFTHLGNGCPQRLDRHDNIVWRVIDEGAITAGIIPDGTHVSPSLFRLLHRALGQSRIYWTTDAMAAAGAPCGVYSLGEIELKVKEDRVARNPSTEGFAGSALEPISGIRRGAEMLGMRWQEVWDFFSAQPARLMNRPCVLEPGSPAGFCLLREV